MSHLCSLTCAAFALSLVTASPAFSQTGACNVPAKEPIVHLEVPGSPFEPVISADGCWIFVTLTQGDDSNGGSIAVVHRVNGTLSIARTISLKGNPAGAVLTHDGKLLVVADGGYIAFLDATRLESGEGDPMLGYMGTGSPVGYIYANVTPDDKYALVSAERAQAVIVADLEQERNDAFKGRHIVKLDVGNAPISVTLSPDGRYLYTTSEAALPDWHWASTCRPENPNARPGAPYHPPGAIMVFDMAHALADSSHAAVSRVPAGCNPVRLVLSPKGDVAFVSARGDNSLLAFDAERLVTDATHALLGRTQVGIAPVGIAVIDDGARVVVTTSNRFGGGASDHQPLTVVDVARLRASQPAVIGTLQAGAFPRELRLSADARTLFATNFASRTLEMIDLRLAPVARP